jgi:predicted TIM-barrel fold metal-dependent hydrolase
MFASDYPHWDGAWPRATTELKEHAAGHLPDDVLARVAGANAQDFYKLSR